MFARYLKRIFLVALTFALVWAVVIFWWQSTNRAPGPDDMALGLVVLPLGLIFAYWLFSRMIESLRAPAGAGLAPMSASAGNQAPPAPLQAERMDGSMLVLASALRLPAGSDFGAVRDFLKSGDAVHKLCDEYSDADGLPVQVARIESLGIDAIWELRDVLASAPGSQQLEWHDWQLRSLRLLNEVCEELVSVAIAHTPKAPSRGAAKSSPMLNVLVGMSRGWGEPQRVELLAQIRRVAVSIGWPADRVSVGGLTNAGDVDALAAVDRQIALAGLGAKEEVETLLLVLAADSQIDEHVLAEWQSGAQSSAGRKRREQVAGEAAAGLLLALNSSEAGRHADPRVAVHRAAIGRRAVSADESGKADSSMLVELSARACEVANIPCDQIAAVVSDADRRVSRQGEVLSCMGTHFPVLDPLEHGMSVGQACGTAGFGQSIAALALAHSAVFDTGHPVLVLGVQDPFERLAVALKKVAVEAVPLSSGQA